MTLRSTLAGIRWPRAELTVFALATAFYTVMAAPGVGWMDSGELTAAAWNLGGAHPPGHPAHSLVGRLAGFLPLGEIAFRVNLLSAATMGAALAGVIALARRLVPERDAALAGAGVGVVLAALAPAALVNATRAEVYGPVAALVIWSLVAALPFIKEEAAPARGFLLAALGFALAAAFHPVIAASAALPVAVALGLRARRRLLRLAPLALALGLLALLTYAYLPVRGLAASPPLLVWGDPTSPASFFEVVTGAVYRSNFSGAGAFQRFAGAWMLLGAATGLGVLLGGLIGLGVGAATGLRGAATCVAVVVCLAIGAALQDALNPDLPGYLLPGLLLLAAGLAPLVAVGVRLLPAEMAGPAAPPENPSKDPNSPLRGMTPWAPRTRPLAIAALLVPLVAAGLLAGGGEPLDRDDAPTRLWAATVGAMPPGPGLYFTSGDHTLFAAQYERLVAGGRPDLAIANPELCRDEWFLRHVKRMMPLLYVPYIDDHLRGHTAERLAITNMRQERMVGGDLPAFGRLRTRYAGAVGRAYQYMLSEADAADPARPPPDFEGRIGRRVATLVGLERGGYELERGRFAAAARAAGLTARFSAEEQAQLASAKPRADRPPLLPLVPRHTRVLLHEEWMTDLFADELAWQAGLAVPSRSSGDTYEQRLHARWRALLRGELVPGSPELLDAGPEAALATTRLLVALGRAPAVEKHLFAFLERWPDDPAAIALYASLRFNQGDLATAEKLFRRSISLAPEVGETRARLSVVLASSGKLDEARAEWKKAIELDPTVPDRLPSPDTAPPK
jgi:tetratricopeptide (TPR) repeat protein